MDSTPPLISVPEKPAIIQVAEPWETRLRRDLAKSGVPYAARGTIVAEVKRLQGLAGHYLQPDVLRPTLEDLAKFGGLTGAFVPGMTGAVSRAVSAGAGLTSFSAPVTGTGTGTTITIPVGGRVEGNFCLILNNSAQNSAFSFATPSGFTPIKQDSAVNGSFTTRGCVSAKILDGTETTVSGMTGTYHNDWVVMCFEPDLPLTSFTNGAAPKGQGLTGDPTAQTIVMLGETALPIIGWALFCSEDNTFTPTRTGLTGVDLTWTKSGYVAYNVGDTPATLTADMADEGFINVLQSGYFTFT